MAITDSHPFEEAFGDLFRTLNELPFPYCLMGALALGAWGTPRATHDLDAMIAIGHTDRPQLSQALRGYGFTEDTRWAERNPMIRNVHVRLQRGAIPVDLMLPKDNHDQSCLARRRRYELSGLSLWIISPEDLVVHKLKAGRAAGFHRRSIGPSTPSHVTGLRLYHRYHRLGKAVGDLGRVAVCTKPG